jgi:uncharacterized membrane protein
MTVVAIIIALVLAFLAFKFVKGLIKFGVIALIVIAIAYFVLNKAAL